MDYVVRLAVPEDSPAGFHRQHPAAADECGASLVTLFDVVQEGLDPDGSRVLGLGPVEVLPDPRPGPVGADQHVGVDR